MTYSRQRSRQGVVKQAEEQAGEQAGVIEQAEEKAVGSKADRGEGNRERCYD